MAMYITDTKFFYSVPFLLIALTAITLIGSIHADAAVDKNTVAVWLFEEGAGDIAKDASVAPGGKLSTRWAYLKRVP